MKMKFRIGLWVVVVLLSAIYFFICFMYYSASYPDEGPVLFFQAIEFLVFLIMFLVPSLLVATLVAFIPFRQRDYKEKLLRILPITLAIFLTVFSLLIGVAGYMVEKEGRQSGPLTKYENIEIPETLDCTTVHEGSFANKAGVF